MTPAAFQIRRFLSLPSGPRLLAGIDHIFFSSSNTQTFADDEARAAFRGRWLGRYLAHDPRWAYVAVAPDGAVAGYLVGSTDDPARAERFSDLAYFQEFADLTQRYPAQLHVNVDARSRGRGIGAALVAAFVEDLRHEGVAGVHAITSQGARNVGFYQQQGFSELRAVATSARPLVFLARDLRGA